MTDTEWNLIAYCFPKPAATGRPRQPAYRELLKAIFYLLRTGCQWRNLPKDLPPWPTVYDSFRQWERSELIPRIHAQWRDHRRLLAQRHRQPTAGILDRQSVKASETGGARGDDAGRKINGRKRPILVDSLGRLRLVLVLPANSQERDGARQLLAQAFQQ